VSGGEVPLLDEQLLVNEVTNEGVEETESALPRLLPPRDELNSSKTSCCSVVIRGSKVKMFPLRLLASQCEGADTLPS
jgi:hypothetical protein